MFTFFGKILILMGTVLVIVGLFLFFADKIPLKLGKLPGDIVIKGKRTVFYFPIMTSIIISVILTIVLNLIFKFFKK